MSLNSATIELLLSKGLTGEDLLEVARTLEAALKPRSPAAERQARYRQRKARDVTSNATNDVTSDATRDATPPPKEYISNPLPLSCESGTLLPVSGKSKRGTRLADDFVPPEEWIAWAMKKRGWGREEALDEAECFARYWQSKPGREACKLDWPKVWQNWAVNSRRESAKARDAPVWDGVA